MEPTPESLNEAGEPETPPDSETLSPGSARPTTEYGEIQEFAYSDAGAMGWSVEDVAVIGDRDLADVWAESWQDRFYVPAGLARIVSDDSDGWVIYECEMSPFEEDITDDIAYSVGFVPGVPFENGADILSEAGVPAEYRIRDLETLATNLDAGYNILLFIDEGEALTGESSKDCIPDHVVVVAGIDLDQGAVLLSDPGSPAGDLSNVPIEVFLAAWGHCENAMIVCEAPTSLAIRHPWILLPVSLPGVQLTAS